MKNLTNILVGLSLLAFVLAVVGAVYIKGSMLGVAPEGYSRACSNLALISLALRFCIDRGSAS